MKVQLKILREMEKKDMKKEKVIVYALYDEEELDYSYEKEEKLKEYCKDKNYEIIKLVRQPKPYHYLHTIENIIDLVKYNDKFDKVVFYALNELCISNNHIITLGTIAEELEINIETIDSGIISPTILDYNCLETNKKYLIQAETPFYD